MRLENSYNFGNADHSKNGVQIKKLLCGIQTYTIKLSNKGQNVLLLKVEVIEKSIFAKLVEFDPRANNEIPLVFHSFFVSLLRILCFLAYFAHS